MIAPYELGAAEAAAAIRAGDLTAQALAEALLDRCTAAASLNAFIRREPERVRAAALGADQQRARGDRLAPLHGVPLVLKDNIDTADFPTTAGTPALAANRPKRNAPIVQRLLDAGAIVLGKANLQELAWGPTNNNAAFGPARNPYDPSRIPGGSSGGTGAAVAARLAPAGLGTDTGLDPRAGVTVRRRQFASDHLALATGWDRANLAHARHRRPDGTERRRLRTDRRHRHWWPH
jgi:indoleacetamide hydrolase